MTKAERLAKAVEDAQALLDKKRTDLAKAQAAVRQEARKIRDQQRYQMGTLVEQSGLCALGDEAILGVAFRALAACMQDVEMYVAWLGLWGEKSEASTEPVRGALPLPGVPVASAPPAGSLPHSLNDETGAMALSRGDGKTPSEHFAR